MPKTNQSEMELKIREAARVNDPAPQFVDALWQKIVQQEPAPSSSVKGRTLFQRPAFVILVVTLLLIGALFIGFGHKKVFAFIRDIFSMNDPGLQAVEEAGLVTDLDISAEPTVMDNAATAEVPKEVTPLSLSQSLGEITVTLDWVYIDSGRLALAFTPASMPPELAFGTPTLTFDGFSPGRREGSVLAVMADNGQYIFVSYQVINPEIVGDRINFSVELPLMKPAEPKWEEQAVYRFDLQGILVYQGRTVPLQQTTAVSMNNIEVRLESVIVAPSYTDVVVCYDFPPGDAPFWHIFDSTLQIGESAAEKQRSYNYLDDIDDDHCVQMGFGIGGATPGEHLLFKVNEMEVPLTIQDELPAERIMAANEILAEYGIEIAPATAEESEGPGGWVFVTEPNWGMTPEEDPRVRVYNTLLETVAGPWEFYVDLPTSALFNQTIEITPEPTPEAIGSQTQSDVTVTLDWIFVDALRAGLGYTITGLPNEPEAAGVLGEAHLIDAEGNLLDVYGANSSEIHWVEDEPGVIQGTWSVAFPEPLLDEEVQLQWTITLDGTNPMYYLAGFPVDTAATPYPMGEHPPFIPEGNVGTFTFDVTAEVHSLTIVENLQSTTVNGVLMSVPKAIVTPSMAKVMICYQKPTERDWWIWSAGLNNGSENGGMSGGRVIYDTDYQLKPGSNPDESLWVVPPEFQSVEHGRCLVMDFLQGQSNPARPLILKVDSLNISPPEVIPESELAAAREILKAQGIEFNYMTSHGTGGGGGGIEFTVMPEGMTDQEAYEKYNEALGYVRTGPWEITLIQ